MKGLSGVWYVWNSSFWTVIFLPHSTEIRCLLIIVVIVIIIIIYYLFIYLFSPNIIHTTIAPSITNNTITQSLK
jgi:hypothetical protein